MDDSYFDREAFRELIKKCMGRMNQKEFSEFAGISHYTLNSMLNDDKCSVPRKTTLTKIAEASRGAVTVEQLLDVCGYEVSSKHDLSWIDEKYPETVNAQIAFDYRDALLQTCGTALKYGSIENFLETVVLTDGQSNMKVYLLDDDEENKVNIKGHKNAERYSHCYVKWMYDGYDGYLYFTVFYCKTENGGYIISDIAFDLNTLMELYHPKALPYVFMMAEKGDVNYKDFPTVLYIRKHKPGEAEMRLLKSIFGDDYDVGDTND